jgi:hypothetical protein
MTRGSYFQNYANLENHTTNNTLLILRHVCQASPAKLAKILGELLEQEIPIGPSFQQQVRIEESIPDGHISQAGIQLYIETKTAGKLWRDQIERHVLKIGRLPETPEGSSLSA